MVYFFGSSLRCFDLIFFLFFLLIFTFLLLDVVPRNKLGSLWSENKYTHTSISGKRSLGWFSFNEFFLWGFLFFFPFYWIAVIPTLYFVPFQGRQYCLHKSLTKNSFLFSAKKFFISGPACNFRI